MLEEATERETVPSRWELNGAMWVWSLCAARWLSGQFWLCMANLCRWNCVLARKERKDVCHEILRDSGDELVFMRAQSVAVGALNALEVEGRVTRATPRRMNCLAAVSATQSTLSNNVGSAVSKLIPAHQ